jgi:hypothetical protein
MLVLVAVALLGVVGAIVAVVANSGGDDGPGIHISSRGTEDITSRPEDPMHPRNPVGSNSDPGPLIKPPIRHPNNNGSGQTLPNGNNGQPSGSGSGSSGKTEVEIGPGAVTDLKPTDVEDMSAKQSSGSTRCYEQALKKDIFLDVKKIAVTITVDPTGQVNDVSLSNGGADFLGKCLSSRIRGWKFRPSTKGITAKFTMVFSN